MRVLIVGSGGREHALTWKAAQSPRVERLFVAPGNAGTAALAENVPIRADDIEGLVAFAREHVLDLVIVGPEGPLALGLVDALQAVGVRVFGPTRAAAQIYNVVDDQPLLQSECYRWLAKKLNRALPAIGRSTSTPKRGDSNKRVSNAKLRRLGWTLRYSTFAEAMEKSVLPSF